MRYSRIGVPVARWRDHDIIPSMLAATLRSLAVYLLAHGAMAAPSVETGTVAYGVWAPEFRELHVRIPLTLDPGDGPDVFEPVGVTVNGAKPTHAMWYFDDTPFDYAPIPEAGRHRVNVFIPIFWRPEDRHSITLSYRYGETRGSTLVEATAPASGGAWSRAQAPANLTFAVREEIGLDRSNEVVEYDVVMEQARFPDPVESVRATCWDGEAHTEVPCQVFAVDRVPGAELTHFRVAVQLSVPAGQQVVVGLWNGADTRPPPVAGPLTRTLTADAVEIANQDYAIRLSPRSGQLMTWHDRRRDILFDYDDPRNLDEWLRVINRTPDVYQPGKPWSHVFDWDNGEYQETLVAGPVFMETVRWGRMPFVGDEFSATVRYRFTAGIPEVRIESVLSVDRDTQVLALRNGGLCVTPSLFTHAAWPRGDGRIETLALARALGNDTGAPPAARMPVDTPWIALWHDEKGYGFGVHTLHHAYVAKGPATPSRARQKAYVSVYRHRSLYMVRSVTQTYQANIRSLPVPLPAGAELYETMVWAPFSLVPGQGTDRLRAVEATDRRLRHPLVVVP